MNRKKYSLGLDFGTESGRAVLVDIATGEEVATSVYNYADGVIDEVLPDGRTKLEHDWALQNPADYIDTLKLHCLQISANLKSLIEIDVSIRELAFIA